METVATSYDEWRQLVTNRHLRPVERVGSLLDCLHSEGLDRNEVSGLIEALVVSLCVDPDYGRLPSTGRRIEPTQDRLDEERACLEELENARLGLTTTTSKTEAAQVGKDDLRQLRKCLGQLQDFYAGS